MHIFLLSVACHTTFVIASAVAAVATARVKFPFNFVQGYVVATVRHVAIRTVAVFYRRVHFDLVGVAVVAEGTFVTGGTEPVIRCGVEAVVLDKSRSMAKGAERFHGAFLLVFMAFRAADLLSDGQCFGMRSGESGDGFHLGAGGYYADKSG